MRTTLSLFKADVGSIGGHTVTPEALKAEARETLDAYKQSNKLIDFYVTNCGDDLELLLTHNKGRNSPYIHEAAWNALNAAGDVAEEMGLYGAKQDLLKDGFTGNIKGMGPGIVELEFDERPKEPFLALMMDKTEPGAFNLALHKMFADPYNSAGLVVDSKMQTGFDFEVWNIKEKTSITLSTPEENYKLLALIGAKSTYVVKHVYARNPETLNDLCEPVACVSTDKLHEIAGKYVGKDDPAAIIRLQSGLPALGEAVEPFSKEYLVSGWMRGCHNGPLMPVGQKDAVCTRFDGPPRAVALSFNVRKGKLTEPMDIFADKAYDLARTKALKLADSIRQMGPFEPHRLPEAEMEYTTLPKCLNDLKERFSPITD